MIVSNLDDLMKYLGRAIMSATSFEFIAPYVQMAQLSMLERALGPQFCQQLDDLVNSENEIPDNRKSIVEKAQRALAWSAYVQYLPFAIGNDGDNGLQEMGTEGTNPVRIGVLDRRIRAAERNMVESLESLLQYLEANLESYTEYRDSVDIQKRRALFLSSATAMSEFLPIIDNNYRLFLNLIPYLRLAEKDYFLPRLGVEQFNRLKAGLKAGDLTEKEKELMDVIRRALAHTAYWIGLPNLQFVLLDNGNLRVLSDFDGIYNRKAPDSETILSLVRTAETEAKKWQNAMRSYLSGNLEHFPLYAASQAAKEAPVNKLPDNRQYSSIFRMK